jgi:hypothetical protein
MSTETLRLDELAKLSEPERFARLVESLNELSDASRQADAGAFKRQVIPVPLRTGATVADSFPFTVKLGANIPSKPLSISVARVENLTDAPATWTDAVQVFWELAGPQLILIRHISGLAASKQYTIHLLVLG